MSHPLLNTEVIEQTPGVYLNETGDVFALFDAQVQDSGNISYGVQVGEQETRTIPAPFCPTRKG